jgi:hypothetical protein
LRGEDNTEGVWMKHKNGQMEIPVEGKVVLTLEGRK